MKLGVDDASNLRLRICGILCNTKSPKNNMTRKQRRTLMELREMEEMVILPPDKGNTIVLMKKEENNTKMKDMLATPTYKELKKDPTAAQETRIGRVL